MHLRETIKNDDGTITKVWFDFANNRVIEEVWQDADPVLEDIASVKDHWNSIKTDMPLMASLPVTIYNNMLDECGYNPLVHTHNEKLAMIRLCLDKPEYSRFRVREGRMGKTSRGA